MLCACLCNLIEAITLRKQKIYSIKTIENRRALVQGLHHGIPIALGYFAVSFSLGIAAREANITVLQGFLMSLFCKASAGQYIGITLIAAGATYLEIALATLVVNARYMLMSCSLSQLLKQDTPLFLRGLVGDTVTDEIFGISIARGVDYNPWYGFGAVLIAAPSWALGTSCGILAGNVLPVRLVSALSVALFGMFLAVFIPPARKNKVIACLVVICFAASYICTQIPGIRDIAEGTRNIVLTVVISAAAALLFPRKEEEDAA